LERLVEPSGTRPACGAIVLERMEVEMKICGLDHIVLTVRDITVTIEFYQRVLGMRHVVFDEMYNALHFGNQKINLHLYRAEYIPHADIPAPGTGDLCFIAEGNIDEIVKEMRNFGIPIEVGPVNQTGAQGQMTSVYFRDPDKNLIEVACYA
jgi:catechol 2,3-dioxygenase-like lactoylglutathione lyase family enzyme